MQRALCPRGMRMRLQICGALLVAQTASAAWGVREALDRHRDQPWTERIQDELRSHRVVVYSKTSCPHSRAVKELLRSLSLGYVAVELDQVPEGRTLQRALARLTGVSTVPQVFIHGQFVGTADGTREALETGRLQRLLIPVLPETAVELCSKDQCVARCDVRGNLGECGVIFNRGDDWLKDRWQAASDMGGTAIPGPHRVDIDFGRDVRVCSVEIDWETAYAEEYDIQIDGVSVFEGATPSVARKRTSGHSPAVKGRPLHVVHDTIFDECVPPARTLTIEILKGATPWGVSIWHVGIMGTVA